jgi:Uma2 family endonuclease
MLIPQGAELVPENRDTLFPTSSVFGLVDHSNFEHRRRSQNLGTDVVYSKLWFSSERSRMSAAIDTDQHVILRNISWSTYEGLLADLHDRTTPRVTFDAGVLEIMSPTREHEQLTQIISLLVTTVAEELGIDILNLGSTTYRRADLLRGFEPDSSFYIQSLDRVIGKKTLDLSVDPPPDLVIEVDITSNSINKLPIFASIGIPEVWRYDGASFSLHILTEGSYPESKNSSVLPKLHASVIASFIEDAKVTRSTAWLKSVRRWVRETLLV